MYANKMFDISPEVIEAGKLDGAIGFKEFWHIVLPLTFPTLSVFLITGVATIFTNQANLYSFYGHLLDHEYQTIGYYLFLLVNGEQYGEEFYTYASALGIACTLIAFPLTMLVKKLLNGKEDF
jgi:multiple sugar transport system permease protein